jgi:hypothetical protein
MRSEEEIVEGVRERLLEAVRIRLKADVPVAIYLSGGIDSSSVAGMVADLMKQGTKLGSEPNSVPSNMKCFTVQFDEDSGADESGIFTLPPHTTISIASMLTSSRNCSAHSGMAGCRYPFRQNGRRGSRITL